jgi:hypothetical protein
MASWAHPELQFTLRNSACTNSKQFNNRNDVTDVNNGIRAIHANSGKNAIHAMIIARFVANVVGL